VDIITFANGKLVEVAGDRLKVKYSDYKLIYVDGREEETDSSWIYD
jgi:hypothetical protein